MKKNEKNIKEEIQVKMGRLFGGSLRVAGLQLLANRIA
jgi:hypothetical protein